MSVSLATNKQLRYLGLMLEQWLAAEPSTPLYEALSISVAHHYRLAYRAMLAEFMHACAPLSDSESISSAAEALALLALSDCVSPELRQLAALEKDPDSCVYQGLRSVPVAPLAVQQAAPENPLRLHDVDDAQRTSCQSGFADLKLLLLSLREQAQQW